MRFILRTDPDRFLRAGDAARDRRDWEAAAKAYRKFLRYNPRNAGILTQYGHALKESGQLDLAARAYADALEIVPGDADLHLQMGHLNKLRGEPRAAIVCYRRALELDPGLGAARTELDRYQGFNEQHLSLQWRSEVDRLLADAAARIARLEDRVRELEQSSR